MKNKVREEEMRKKWEGYSVVMEVVQVIMEYDNSGQEHERYAMSKMWVDEGKEETTTCRSKICPVPFAIALEYAIFLY